MSKSNIQCEHCNGEGEYHIITGEHLELCPKVLVECDIEGCEEMIKRSESCGIHEKVCEHAIINCKYVELGCCNGITRKNMLKHEQDLNFHLEMALETITGLKKSEVLNHSSKIKQTLLFDAVTKMDQNMQKIHTAVRRSFWQPPKLAATLDSALDNGQGLAVATFKMEDFQSHIRNEKTFHSPPFYTSPGGYKMKIEVQAVENYLSIDLHLVPGENDDHLTWPFQQVEIEVQILNQECDDNHISALVPFYKTQKPRYTSERNEQAVAIKKLRKKHTFGDTLFFRVIVHKAPKLKPWLVCTV